MVQNLLLVPEPLVLFGGGGVGAILWGWGWAPSELCVGLLLANRDCK